MDDLNNKLEPYARELQEAEINLKEFIEIASKIWYDRFEKEIDKLGFKYNVRSINRNMVEAAAKKASGIS